VGTTPHRAVVLVLDQARNQEERSSEDDAEDRFLDNAARISMKISMPLILITTRSSCCIDMVPAGWFRAVRR